MKTSIDRISFIAWSFLLKRQLSKLFNGSRSLIFADGILIQLTGNNWLVFVIDNSEFAFSANYPFFNRQIDLQMTSGLRIFVLTSLIPLLHLSAKN